MPGPSGITGLSLDDFAATSFERIGRLTDASAEVIKPWGGILDAVDGLSAGKPTPSEWAQPSTSAAGCWSLVIAVIAIWILSVAKHLSDEGHLACIFAIAQFPGLLVWLQIRRNTRKARAARNLAAAEKAMAEFAQLGTRLKDLRGLVAAWREVHKRCRNHPERARNMAANAANEVAAEAVRRKLLEIPIESAEIPIIPASLLTGLRMRGVLTAADIEPHSISGIPGIGEKRRAALRAWRVRMERRFTSDMRSPEAMRAADTARAQVAVDARRDEAELERLTAAIRGFGDASAIRAAVTAWGDAMRRLMQAQADQNAVSGWSSR